MRTIILVCSLALFLGCPSTGIPFLTLSGKDPMIVGNWAGRVTIPNVSTSTVDVVFTDSEFSFTERITGGGFTIMQGLYAVDTSARQYKIDFGVVSCTGTGLNTVACAFLQGEVLQGVYEYRGETLRFTTGSLGQPRPLSVDSAVGYYEVTPKRAKFDGELLSVVSAIASGSESP